MGNKTLGQERFKTLSVVLKDPDGKDRLMVLKDPDGKDRLVDVSGRHPDRSRLPASGGEGSDS